MKLSEARELKRWTLDTLKSIEDAEMLTSADVARFIGCDTYFYCWMAKNRPESVPFPFTVRGKRMTRVSFPRAGLIAWAEGYPQKREEV